MSVKSLKCPSCGANVEIDDSREFGYCSYCGSQIQLGERINVDVKVKHDYSDATPQNVTHIHNQYIINTPVADKSPKSRTTALILCVLLGVLGIHQFYAGRTGLGILYVFTGGIIGVGWIVDIIMIIAGRFRDSNGAFITEW